MVTKSQSRDNAYSDYPDRFGEELADDAHIWRQYNEVADEDDKNRLDNWNRGLDNLALFAGLLSAVTSAFLIEARKDLEPDPILQTLRAINAHLSNETYHPAHSTAPGDARAINFLWVASLILSLTAALIAIMGKDWIGMYVRMPSCNLRERADIRTFRLRCTEDWHMSGVIASAPVLLHISIVLFGAGLVVFMSSDPLILGLAAGLSGLVGLLYAAFILSAIFVPTSPFQSPATQALRRLICSHGRISHWFGTARTWLVNTLHSSQHQAGLPAPGGPDAGGAPSSAASVDTTNELLPVLAHWDDIPPASPRRILQSLLRLRQVSPYPWVYRSIVTALGDRTTGAAVARYLSDAYLNSAHLSPKEGQLREGFRETLSSTISGNPDFELVMRYLIIRKTCPESGLVELEDTQLDAVLRDALLDNQTTSENYLRAVCVAYSRRLPIDLETVEKHCQHVDIPLPTASFLMSLLPISALPERFYDLLIIMIKWFGWHRRPAFDKTFLELLQRNLESTPSGSKAVAALMQPPLPVSDGEKIIDLFRHVTLHVTSTLREAIIILVDLLELYSAPKGPPVSSNSFQPLSAYRSLYELFSTEGPSAVSQAAWDSLLRSPEHALRILNILPADEGYARGLLIGIIVPNYLAQKLGPKSQISLGLVPALRHKSRSGTCS